jgi:hypothetical protein
MSCVCLPKKSSAISAMFSRISSAWQDLDAPKGKISQTLGFGVMAGGPPPPAPHNQSLPSPDQPGGQFARVRLQAASTAIVYLMSQITSWDQTRPENWPGLVTRSGRNRFPVSYHNRFTRRCRVANGGDRLQREISLPNQQRRTSVIVPDTSKNHSSTTSRACNGASPFEQGCRHRICKD